MKAGKRILIRQPFVLCATGLLMLAVAPRSALANKAPRWTLSIQLSTRTVQEVVELVRSLQVGRGGGVSTSRQVLTIAGPPSEIERLVHIIREVDDPYTAGQRIWTVETHGIASSMASRVAW